MRTFFKVFPVKELVFLTVLFLVTMGAVFGFIVLGTHVYIQRNQVQKETPKPMVINDWR